MNLNDAIAEVVRSVLRDELPGIIRNLSASKPPPRDVGPAVYTINELRARYKAGRGQILSKIETGELPAIARIMRGGCQGWVVRVEDAERVLAGAQ